MQEEVRTKENENGQIQRNLLAESRQLTALRAELISYVTDSNPRRTVTWQLSLT